MSSISRPHVSETAQKMPPTGKVIDCLNGHGVLAGDYYGFLHSVQPVETWADVGILPEPIPL